MALRKTLRSFRTCCGDARELLLGLWRKSGITHASKCQSETQLAPDDTAAPVADSTLIQERNFALGLNYFEPVGDR